MLRVSIKKEHESYIEPKRAHKTDACFDIYIAEIEKKAEDLAVINLGFSTEIPEGWKGVIVPRSSLTKTNWIMQNSPAQIDSDYRGIWMLKFRCLPSYITNQITPTLFYENFPFKVGERVGQIYFERVNDVALLPVEETSETLRGTGGFGSTGSK